MPVSRRRIQRALKLATEPHRLRPPRAYAGAAAAATRSAQLWASGSGVQGLGIGERITGGNPTGELALKVYVAEKLPQRRLSSPAPSEVAIPWTGENIPIDVEAIGRLDLDVLNGRLRPAIPGCAVASAASRSGTLGCLVGDLPDTGRVYLLSSAHVIANHGRGPAGVDIFQPGGSSDPTERIGALVRWRPFIFTEAGYPNTFDAAIAEVDPAAATREIYRIGRPSGFSSIVSRNMQVQKVGAASGHTVGVVRDIDFTWAPRVPTVGGQSQRAGFRNLVLCSRFTAPGDSGAAVLNMNGRIVGLHFAGAAGGSVFNRIVPILDWLGIRIL